MIRLSRTARSQISSLARYYADLDRPEAVRNLRAIVARAGERIEAGRGQFFPAPRPYLPLPARDDLKFGAIDVAPRDHDSNLYRGS